MAESWALIGPDGWPERSYATTLDDKGSLLLETFNIPTRSEVRNASGRLVFAADLPQGAESRNVEQENRNRYQQLIDERIAKLVGESVFNGRETFVIEWRTSQLPEGTVTVPYIADLNPVEILIRVEFEQDTYRPVKTEHYAIDEKGQQYLIHSRETLVDEVLEITNVPANVVQALGQ